MPKYNVTSPTGEKFVITAPEGATEEEVLAKAQEYFAAQAKDAPKETSLLSDVSTFLQTNPVSKAARGAMKPFMGLAQKAANLTPWGDDVNRYISEEERGQQGLRERSTAFGLPVGTFGMGKQEGIDLPDMVGQGIGYAAPLSKIAPFKTATWGGRAGNAAVQGGAAGFAMPVTNAEDLTLQDLVTGRKKDSLVAETVKNTLGGAAIGAVASPLMDIGIAGVAGGVNKIGQGAKYLANKVTPPSTFSVDMKIVRALEKKGIDWRLLSDDVKKSMREEAQRATRFGGKLDEEALARLADFKALGIKPLRSWVTRDASQFTNEANLAKVQANTGGGSLVDAQVMGNARLEQALSGMGGKAGSQYATAENAIKAVRDTDAQLERVVDGLYNQARSLSGGDIPLDARQKLSALVRELELDGSLPGLGEFGPVVNKIIAGEFPLSVGNAQGLMSSIGRAISTGKGNERYALGKLKDVIANADPAEQLGRDAMDAFQKARSAARARFEWQRSAPAIQDALDGAKPITYFEKYILNKSADPKDISELKKVLPGDVKNDLRALIVQHLREKASQAAKFGETGTPFNHQPYVNALDRIGKEKLELFFTPAELQKLYQIGKAGFRMSAQPKGSAVNNSNTAAAAFKILDTIANKVPFGKAAVGDMFQSMGQARLEAQAIRPQIFEPYKPLDPAQIRGLLGPAVPLAAVGLLGS